MNNGSIARHQQQQQIHVVGVESASEDPIQRRIREKYFKKTIPNVKAGSVNARETVSANVS